MNSSSKLLWNMVFWLMHNEKWWQACDVKLNLIILRLKLRYKKRAWEYGCCPKVKIILWLEFELAYYDGWHCVAHTYIYIYIYIYWCMCVCLCVCSWIDIWKKDFIFSITASNCLKDVSPRPPTSNLQLLRGLGAKVRDIPARIYRFLACRPETRCVGVKGPRELVSQRSQSGGRLGQRRVSKINS